MSSFGPICEFDRLVFLRFNLEENKLYVYDLDINSEKLKKISVSKTSTVEDYQKQGKRPRFSIIKEIIEKNNDTPTVIFNIRRGMIER